MTHMCMLVLAHLRADTGPVRTQDFLTILFENGDVRHTVRKLHHSHRGQDSKGCLATSFDSVHPVRSVIIPPHACEVSPRLTSLRETVG